MKKATKKLQLKRASVAKLSNQEEVQGGLTPAITIKLTEAATKTKDYSFTGSYVACASWAC